MASKYDNHIKRSWFTTYRKFILYSIKHAEVETIDSAKQRDLNMRNSLLYALLDDLPIFTIQVLNVYWLGTIHSLWYIISPVISYISFILNISKCIYYVLVSAHKTMLIQQASVCRYVLFTVLLILSFVVILGIGIFCFFIVITTSDSRMIVPDEFKKDFGL